MHGKGRLVVSKEDLLRARQRNLTTVAHRFLNELQETHEIVCLMRDIGRLGIG